MSLGPKAVCDRCGFEMLLRDLRKEWSNAMVCSKCWDPRPAETKALRLKPEGVPVKDARPEPEPIFRAPGELGGDDL